MEFSSLIFKTSESLTLLLVVFSFLCYTLRPELSYLSQDEERRRRKGQCSCSNSDSEKEELSDVPMNKIKVGMTSSPNLKQIQSKIGSLEKAHHRPGGGNFRVESRKLEWNNSSKTNAYNKGYMPSGGDKKIEVQKLDWKAKSRIGSLENTTHRPGGGSKKIQNHKVEWSAASKVGSTDNVKHKPGGGNVKIINQKVELNVKQGKVGSLDNVKHKPGGGDRKVFNDVEYLRQMSENSNASSRAHSNTHSPEPSQCLESTVYN